MTLSDDNVQMFSSAITWLRGGLVDTQLIAERNSALRYVGRLFF